MPALPNRVRVPALTVLPPFADVSDLDAITQVEQGNRGMFEVIVRRYNQPLYRVGMAYLRNHTLAEDAMQSAYVKAFLQLGKFRRGAAFSTWLTRIMINECLMLLRRQRGSLVEVTGELPADAAAPGPDAPGQIDSEDMKLLHEQAIAALPWNYRAVYMLREVQQLSTAATAACVGISVASVKVQLHRARERLKAELLRSAAGVELFTYSAPRCDPMTARVMQAVRAFPTAKDQIRTRCRP